MRLRKLLCVVLTVLLIATLLPETRAADNVEGLIEELGGEDYAVSDGETPPTVKLKKNVTLTSTLVIDFNVILDLNGHTINGSIIFAQNAALVTIKSSADGGLIQGFKGSYALEFNCSCTLTLGTITIRGGDGDNSTDGDAGIGGVALSLQIFTHNITSEANLYGGNGGDSINGNGGYGGQAFVTNNLEMVFTYKNGTISGGDGGNSLYGKGGDGGSYSMGYANSWPDNAKISDGNGGYGVTPGRGSNGKSGATLTHSGDICTVTISEDTNPNFDLQGQTLKNLIIENSSDKAASLNITNGNILADTGDALTLSSDNVNLTIGADVTVRGGAGRVNGGDGAALNGEAYINENFGTITGGAGANGTGGYGVSLNGKSNINSSAGSIEGGRGKNGGAGIYTKSHILISVYVGAYVNKEILAGTVKGGDGLEKGGDGIYYAYAQNTGYIGPSLHIWSGSIIGGTGGVSGGAGIFFEDGINKILMQMQTYTSIEGGAGLNNETGAGGRGGVGIRVADDFSRLSLYVSNNTLTVSGGDGGDGRPGGRGAYAIAPEHITKVDGSIKRLIPIDGKNGATLPEPTVLLIFPEPAPLTLATLDDCAARGRSYTYSVPGFRLTFAPGAIDTAAVLAALGATDAAEVELIVEVSRPDGLVTDVPLSGTPYLFAVFAVYGGRAEEISDFAAPVEVALRVPGGTDEAEIALMDEQGFLQAQLPAAIERDLFRWAAAEVWETGMVGVVVS